MLPPRRGRIVFDGVDVTRRGVLDHLDRGICFSPQGAQVFPTLSVADNLELGGYTLRQGDDVRRQQQHIYELFPILFERRNAQAGVLSGGERRMLAMGIALMRSPRLYLLDEPSGGLAPLYVERLFSIIQQINRDLGTAILLVEENLRQALSVATASTSWAAVGSRSTAKRSHCAKRTSYAWYYRALWSDLRRHRRIQSVRSCSIDGEGSGSQIGGR